MKPERWQQIKGVFDQAAVRPHGERSAFLDEACRGDDELRGEVESLLESEELDVPVVDGDLFEIFGMSRGHDEAREGLRLGPYRILNEIGRGGMAVVYAAIRDDEQFHQEVAIKLIRRGADSKSIVARFRQERQILAHLDHPNIARLFDGGVTPEGLPYLVMEKIDGEPIDGFCDARRLAIAERLELFRTACAAVHYAHRNLVVHRDLKPSNILVSSDGVVKLLDFGIAKLLETDDGLEDLELTAAGPRPMTPEYASPEQVLGQPVTTASDVYALGVLLYRLLTGRRPYRFERSSQHEIEHAICEVEPPRPSAAVAGSPVADAVGQVPSSRTPRELGRALRGDLDNIVMMAMRKEPERRYGSAAELAGDVRRYLQGLPVLAREKAFAYVAGKLIRRHRFAVTAAALVFLMLLGAVVTTTWLLRVAQKERLIAQSVSRYMTELFELSDPERVRGREVTALQLLERSSRDLDKLEDQPAVQATLMDIMGRVYLNLGSLEMAKKLLLQALDIRLEVLDAGDPALADSQANVAELYATQARFDEAERLHRAALDLRRRTLAEDDERLAKSEIYLAKLLEQRGRFDQAEHLLRTALERQKDALGEEHELVAQTLNNLALVLKGRHRLWEAQDLFLQALALNRRLLGSDHPEVAVSLNNLATVLCHLGQYDEARALFGEVEELKRQILGETHWILTTNRNNLGSCLQAMGDYEGAEKAFVSALELGRETLGADHPNVAASLNNLGHLRLKQRRYAAAEPMLRQAVDVYRQRGGRPDPNIVALLSNLAQALSGLKRFEEAEALEREALEWSRQLYGEAHERVVLCLNNLGEVLRRRDRLEQAGDHFRQAVELQRRISGEDLQLATYHFNLANVWRAMGRLAEAETQYRAAWELRRRFLGIEHRDVANAAMSLGRVLVELERPEQAEPLLRDAVEIHRRQAPTQQQPAKAVAEITLGRCLTVLGRYSEAQSWLEGAYGDLIAQFGAGDRWTLSAKRQLEELDRRRRARSQGSPSSDVAVQ